MRSIFVALLVLLVASAAGGFDLGARRGEKAPRDWPANVPQADRQGGDTIADAVVIPAIPYETTGTTTGFNNDYDETCPYGTSTAPDVVYAFTPPAVMEIDIDMLGSLYDTKIYVYDTNFSLVACNDDFYEDYVSKLFGVDVDPELAPYYLVIDGYGEEHGDYTLSIDEYVPCVLDDWFDAVEGEPPLHDDYEDAYNGGCNFPEFGYPMQLLNPLGLFGGRSGWYSYQGSDYRDTDWFILHLAEGGQIAIEIDAEAPTYFFELAPLNCGTVAVVQTVEAGPCAPATMVINGPPGDVVWLWAGPRTFVPPPGFDGQEYTYEMRFGDPQLPWYGLGAGDDYTYDAPVLEYPYVGVSVGPDAGSVDDADLADLCGADPTPGPDLFASLYLETGDEVGGLIHPLYWLGSPEQDARRYDSVCFSVVSDLRHPDATCLGYQCVGPGSNNTMLTLADAAESGWYYLVADYTGPDTFDETLDFWHPASPPPPAPAHDTCAGAILLERGPIAITDDLTACTNAVDPGRDGCDGRPELAYTSRDAIYRIDFTHGDILELTMLGEGDWEEALYLVRDCENPLGTCVTAATPWGDGVHLTYTALEDETLWLICDSWDVGDRPFTLTGSLDNITDAPPVAPAQLALRAAPNPFNPTTTITYDIPRPTHARLRIHDLAGRLVATLVDAPREPGRHTATWRAESTRGGTLPSGSYIVRLEAAGEVRTTRLTLLK